MNKLDSIVGQEKIANFLSDSLINRRISHAYLLSGADGMGKHTIANAFARSLLCTQNDSTPDGYCGVCQSCVLAKANTNPDFQLIAGVGDKAANVETVRKQMVNDAYIKPIYSNHKVFIVEKAERLNKESQNCLLKTLEEPPEYVTIILLAKSPQGILPTLRSRVVALQLAAYQQSELEQIIRQNGVADSDVKLVVNSCGGNPGVAIKMANSGNNKAQKGSTYMDIRREVVKRCLTMDASSKKAFAFMNYVEEQRESVLSVLNVMETTYRDLCVTAIDQNTELDALLNPDFAQQIKNSSRGVDATLFVKCIEIVEEAQRLLQWSINVNFGLCTQDLFMRIQEEYKRWLR